MIKSSRFSERLLDTVDQFIDLQSILPVFSESGTSVAYKVAESAESLGANKYYIVVNGRRGPTFDLVSPPSFNTDGDRIAYYAELGLKWFVVMDNSIVELGNLGSAKYYDFRLDSAGPRFSPDGRRVLYRAFDTGHVYLVTDNWTSPKFDNVFNAEFTPHGSMIAYVAESLHKQFVVVADWKSPSFDKIGNLSVSRDGSTLAYAATTGEKDIVITVNRKSGVSQASPAYNNVSEVTLSDDGSSLIYVIKRDNRYVSVFNGAEGAEYEEIDWPVLSIDGKQYGYVAKQSGKYFAVINGVPSALFDVVGPIEFSRNRRSVAYPAIQGNRFVVVFDGRRGPEFDYVYGGIQFSADGKQIGYGARLGRELWWKVLDLE